MHTKLTLLFAVLLCGFFATAQTTVTITDADLVGGITYNWTNDNTYILDGLVYLEPDGVLNIEAGTVIKGATVPSSDNTSALIITRGATIVAEGTADEPIIFTAELDDPSSPGAELSATDRGLWGGLIILGSATIAVPEGVNKVEGIAASETRTEYGGTDDDDDSGVLKYVSIRHGGAQLSANNEINGLTLGGVGSGTEIDYVEVFANLDDGIEWFGGTVNVKHASVAFCGDDAYDYDLGFRGKGQFWFALQAPGTSTGRSGEHDGADPDGQAPFSQPTIYNATYVGIGENATAVDGDAADPLSFSTIFRDNAGGFYNNSIFTGFPSVAIAVEDRDDRTEDESLERLMMGDLSLKNNIFEDFGAGDTPADIFIAVDPNDNKVDASSPMVANALGLDNAIGATGIASIDRGPNGMLDPRIDAGGAALTGGVASDDDFFQIVTYRGAFGNRVNWLAGWTALSDYGYLGDEVTPVDQSACTVITDSDLTGTSDITWSAGVCYKLDGLVYLERGGKLTIEPGVIIQGALNPTADNTSALIITQGAQIFAEGTADAPVIFTSELDNTNDDTDLGPNDKGLWGGLIILGEAVIAVPEGTNKVEGIAASEERTVYGGTNDADNSGVLKYVSIRHGGAQLSANNEINGLTLGGVGSGTEIDYVEVFANLDDGIEWFGGTVDVKHAAVSFCGDDAFDYDLGFRGRGQYWFSLQGPGQTTGRAGEHDGADPDGQAPFSNPTIYNATYVGIGEEGTAADGDAADPLAFSVIFRDNAGGSYNNSVFYDYNSAAIAIEDRDDRTEDDSFERFTEGDLSLNDNFFFGFGREGGAAADIFLAVDQNESIVPASSATVAATLTAGNNRVEDPVLVNDERDEEDRTFDVRPNTAGPSSFGAPAPADAFFDTQEYYGAFAPGNGDNNPSWLSDWTAVATAMEIGNEITSVGRVETNGLLLDAPVPNPASSVTRINFTIPRAVRVDMTVADVLGRPVARRQQHFGAGEQFLDFNVSELPSGTYYVLLDAAGSRLIQKMVVSH